MNKTFEIREAALRTVLRKLNESTSITSMSSLFDVDEKVLREFIKPESSKSLRPKNYDNIVKTYASAPMYLDLLDFRSLVNICNGLDHKELNPPYFIIDFYPTYTKEDQKFKDLRDFLIKDVDKGDAKEPDKKRRGFLEIINSSEWKDPFDMAAAIGKYSDKFEKLTEDKDLKIYIYGISHQDYLLKEDSKKQVLLFFGSGNAFDPYSDIALTETEQSISGIDRKNKTIKRTFLTEIFDPAYKG